MRTLLLTIGILISAASNLFSDEKPAAVEPLPVPFTAEQFQKHVIFLASDELAGRAVGSEGWNKGADYVIKQFQTAGLKPLLEDGSWFQPFPLKSSGGSVTARNILSVLPGKGDLKDQAVIVTAHLDHLGTMSDAKPGDDAIYNGADDNASGVAALLLIAQALGNQKSPQGDSFRTVIVTLFDAEEHGLLGADYYVNHPAWPLDKTAAVINFDGMGRLRMGKVYASDAETNPVLAKVAEESAKSRGLIAETRFGGHGRSDHAIFVDRGIPGMHFFTGANSDYHQVTDESDRLNFEGGATIAWIGWQVLQSARMHPGRLEFEKANPLFDMQFALNFVKTMGVIPVLDAQEGRYPQILFVLPNTPAAKYGLKAADQIMGVNGIRFKRVEDALTAFQQLTFEDGLRFEILRGNKEVEVRVPASFFEEMSGPKSTKLDNGKYEVQFRYQAPATVKMVYLAGEFNQWNAKALKMDGPDKDGVFSTRMEMQPGIYQYKFVHEGTDWVADPRNIYQAGRFGNSVLRVGPEKK